MTSKTIWMGKSHGTIFESHQGNLAELIVYSVERFATLKLIEIKSIKVACKEMSSRG